MTPGEIEAVFVELKASLARFIPAVAEETLTRVQVRTPVRTGVLQAGWKAAVEPPGFTISNDVPYAAYVEFGTPKMAPVGMLSTTLLEMDQITQVAKEKSGLK